MELNLIQQVENIIGYTFQKKELLIEALTHSSFMESVSYERLEFMGDSILNHAITNTLFINYPDLQPGQLSLLRAANTNTEKLARVAVRHCLHHFVRHDAAPLVDQVVRFVDAIAKENHPVVHGGSVKAPKILADITESVIGAVYVDLNFDLKKTWMAIGHVLEPMVTPDDLKQQPQPVTALFQICQEKGMHVDIKQLRNKEVSIANVFIDGKIVASASSAQKYLAKLEASKIALDKLGCVVPTNMKSPTNIELSIYNDDDGTLIVVDAKIRLHQLCQIKRWSNPRYIFEITSGPAHKMRYVRIVQIETEDGILQISGDKKSNVKDADNSAASLMLLALQQRNQLIICEKGLKRKTMKEETNYNPSKKAKTEEINDGDDIHKLNLAK